jgi:hypothetical protein
VGDARHLKFRTGKQAYIHHHHIIYECYEQMRRITLSTSTNAIGPSVYVNITFQISSSDSLPSGFAQW